MKIGNIELGDKPLFLAPMEDVTDASFRFICKEFGADMMYTEFISSDGLIRDARKSAPNSLQMKRKDASVTSSIGAKNSGLSPKSMFPIFIQPAKIQKVL